MPQTFLGSRWPPELGQRWADACLAFQAKTHRVALLIIEALALALHERGICDVPLQVLCLPRDEVGQAHHLISYMHGCLDRCVRPVRRALSEVSTAALVTACPATHALSVVLSRRTLAVQGPGSTAWRVQSGCGATCQQSGTPEGMALCAGV